MNVITNFFLCVLFFSTHTSASTLAESYEKYADESIGLVATLQNEIPRSGELSQEIQSLSVLQKNLNQQLEKYFKINSKKYNPQSGCGEIESLGSEYLEIVSIRKLRDDILQLQKIFDSNVSKRSFRCSFKTDEFSKLYLKDYRKIMVTPADVEILDGVYIQSDPVGLIIGLISSFFEASKNQREQDHIIEVQKRISRSLPTAASQIDHAKQACLDMQKREQPNFDIVLKTKIELDAKLKDLNFDQFDKRAVAILNCLDLEADSAYQKFIHSHFFETIESKRLIAQKRIPALLSEMKKVTTQLNVLSCPESLQSELDFEKMLRELEQIQLTLNIELPSYQKLKTIKENRRISCTTQAGGV